MASTTPVPLLIVVLNYRTAALTVDCLRSLVDEVPTVPGTRVIVVDNASGDGSAGTIGAAIAGNGWGGWAELVESDRNRGFAGGNNVGIARGEPARYVLLLNSDTIVQPGCLRHCMEVMEASPRVGALSCCLLNQDGSLQNTARRFPTPLRMTCAALGLPRRFPRLFGWADTEDPGWDRGAVSRDVDWLGGAFLWVRSEALGGTVRLDEDFFFYGEDIEFSHRIRRRGFTCRYDAVSRTVHLGGASSDPTRLPSSERSVHQWRARYLVQRKCYGILASLWTRAVDVTFTALRLIAAPLRRVPAERRAELKAQLSMMLRRL